MIRTAPYTCNAMSTRAREGQSEVAILGVARDFAMEPRIKAEIAALAPLRRTVGFGENGTLELDRFVRASCPARWKRLVARLSGCIVPQLRMAIEMRHRPSPYRHIAKGSFEFAIAHHISDALAAIESAVPFLFHSHEYLPRQYDSSLLFRLSESRYRRVALQRIFRHAVATIVEGQRVAELYSEEFGVPIDRFIVMPSMPVFRAHVDRVPQVRHDGAVRMIHHGYISPVRGIEGLLEVRASLGDRYSLTLMGPGDPAYLAKLRRHPLACKMVEFRDAVPPARVVEEISVYDIGLVAFFVPHFHCRITAVPNKFWDCLQARVPPVVLPESAMADIVRSSGCGWVARGNSLDDYASSIAALTDSDVALARTCCENTAWIHSRDSWLPALGAQLINSTQRPRS